jgi:ParB family chromosome partitioning protein
MKRINSVKAAISGIVIGERTRKEIGDISDLAKSIKKDGQLQPIGITNDGRLIFGARRIAACKSLGLTEIDAVIFETLDDAARISAEANENIHRKEYTPEEMATVFELLKRELVPAAEKSRRDGQRSGGKSAGNGRPKSSSGKNFPQPTAKKAAKVSDQAAAILGVSRPTAEKALAVVKSGDAELIAEMNATGKVDPAFRKLGQKSAGQTRAKRNAKKPESENKDGAFLIADEAIDCLMRISKSDANRAAALAMVKTWIETNI